MNKIYMGLITKYNYDGDLIAEETDSIGIVTASYVYDDKGAPVSVNKGGQTYYYHYNGHGDVVALTNSTGSVAATYQYDEWCNVTYKRKFIT